MKEYQSLAHTRWDCKYHVVFIPKMRKKMIFGSVRKHLGEIPPKYSVSYVVGYIKGKSAIGIARRFTGKTRNFTGENFWARGYFVSTVGLDEEMVREYIRHQEEEDERYEQLKLRV